MIKIFLFYITLCLVFCSCSSTYYYATLDSTNPYLEKLDEGDFIYENDSLWIMYSFEGEDAPIKIAVFNKLDIPLYVDWNRSSLIIDNTAYSYNDGIIEHFAESESTTYDSWFGAKTYTNISGITKLPENVTFIPPNSKINHQTLRLSAKFDDIDTKNFRRKKIVTNNQDELATIQSMNYEYENSPLRFSSFLTVYTNPDEYQDYQSEFYTTNLIKTKVKPKKLPLKMGSRGDIFYQRKRPNTTGWEILGVTAAFAGVVTLNVLTYDKDNNTY